MDQHITDYEKDMAAWNEVIKRAKKSKKRVLHGFAPLGMHVGYDVLFAVDSTINTLRESLRLTDERIDYWTEETRKYKEECRRIQGELSELKDAMEIRQ